MSRQYVVLDSNDIVVEIHTSGRNLARGAPQFIEVTAHAEVVRMQHNPNDYKRSGPGGPIVRRGKSESRRNQTGLDTGRTRTRSR